MTPEAQGVCQLHQGLEKKCDELRDEQRELRDIQRQRPCGTHDEAIKTLKKSDDDQWAAINSLKMHIYIGMGGLAVISFLIHILAAYLIKVVFK